MLAFERSILGCAANPPNGEICRLGGLQQTALLLQAYCCRVEAFLVRRIAPMRRQPPGYPDFVTFSSFLRIVQKDQLLPCYLCRYILRLM
jgi:hypothetical protein